MFGLVEPEGVVDRSNGWQDVELDSVLNRPIAGDDTDTDLAWLYDQLRSLDLLGESYFSCGKELDQYVLALVG